MAKAILFIRVSGEQQNTESQRDALTHYAMADGYSAKDIIYIEKKESGYKLEEFEREGLVELYKAMEDPEVADTYIWELSRLSRRPKDLYSIREKFLERKIQLHCQEPSFTLLNRARTGYDSNANILFSLFGAMAEQEVIEKQARFARGKKRLAEQGRYNGGAVPYGYKVDPSQGNLIVIDEDYEAPIVREIFNLYEQGYSQMDIAKELYTRGVKGRAVRKTKNITISLVHQVLTNELLTGKEHKSKGSSFIRKYPPIISEEQYNRCRVIAERNNTVLPKSRRVYYAHKLIECTECKRFFVSTGDKGYYHCKDAYNYNKEYEGYEGVPRCSNRVCISINILDSLLWSLAVNYEVFFIMSEARKTISTYEEKIRVLKEKVKTIPERLSAIDGELERLADAYVDGTINKAKYELKKEEKRKRRHEILSEKAEYLSSIEHINTMMAQAKKSLESDASVEGFINTHLTVDRIKKRVSSITDDQERSDIIHRHIEKVTVEKTTIVQTFRNHPEGKEVLAKKITVYPFSQNKEVFYFVPYDGKGGRMLTENAIYQAVFRKMNPGMPSERKMPLLAPYTFTHIQRTKDEGKYRRREQAKSNREALEKKEAERLQKNGLLSMAEMQQRTNLSYATIYCAIKNERLNATRMLKTWYAKETDFLSYLNKYKPQPRPKRKNKQNSTESPSKEDGE